MWGLKASGWASGVWSGGAWSFGLRSRVLGSGLKV